MSPTQLAAVLGVSKTSVYRLLARKELGHFRIHGKILIGKDHMDEFLAKREVSAD
jgi:excisionase family DNA binding protein